MFEPPHVPHRGHWCIRCEEPLIPFSFVYFRSIKGKIAEWFCEPCGEREFPEAKKFGDILRGDQ